MTVPSERRPVSSNAEGARLASLGLVVTCGFLLSVSLATSAALAALSTYLAYVFPNVQLVVSVFDLVMSAVLIGGMFAAMFKVLPDAEIAWRDVAVGALASAAVAAGGIVSAGAAPQARCSGRGAAMPAAGSDSPRYSNTPTRAPR